MIIRSALLAGFVYLSLISCGECCRETALEVSVGVLLLSILLFHDIFTLCRMNVRRLQGPPDQP